MKKDGVLYKANNAYIIIDSDGLDPIFGCLDELFVIGGNMIIFSIMSCSVSHFDPHYHAYAVTCSSKQSFILSSLDHNVYYGHTLADGLTYIALKSFSLVSLQNAYK